jgi:Ca-activated chloride channel family protein
MKGEPITQARKAIEACLAALSEQDLFGLFAFDNTVESMSPELVAATRENREAAPKFLNSVDARGGTQLVAGVSAAAKAIGAAGDILILTDGQVSETESILQQARALGIRVSCLGIGSASQDRFLSLLARETGGNSRFVTARERVDLPAIDLFASIGRPVASGLKAPAAQPEPPSLVFAGTPVLLLGELDAAAGNRVELTWDGGRLDFDLPPADAAIGDTLRLLRGSRLITDWDSRYPATEAVSPIARRRESRVGGRLLELSRTYGLASREMSLVAVVKRAGDRPGELPETRVVPVGMPQDTDFSAYFLEPMALRRRATSAFVAPPPAPAAGSDKSSALFCLEMAECAASAQSELDFEQSFEPADDNLIEFAALIEPDGGMPGKTPEVRAVRSIALLHAFAAAGHTLSRGAFRAHVKRLVDFLESLTLSGQEARQREGAIQSAEGGSPPKGPWSQMARDGASWADIAELHETKKRWFQSSRKP